LQYRRKSRDSVEVIAYNFKEQLISLLGDDDLFGHLGNLVVNKDDPFTPYESKEGNFEEVPDGDWYSQTRISCQLNGDDFLLPIILYVDKTGTDAYQRYTLEPIIFSTPI
jgi:hypothetical protein